MPAGTSFAATHKSVIDKESERAVTGWLRLGDRMTGRKPVEGNCDRCHQIGYLSEADSERICASCCLEGEAKAS